jgi:hypothetical protein
MPVKREFCHLLTCFFFFLLILPAVSCGHGQRKYLIPKDQMVDVLVDMHLADAIALQNDPAYSGFELDSADLYQAVFNKHGVTQAMFDSTLSYYSARPEEFQFIYTRVTGKLNLIMQEELDAPVSEPEPKKPELIWQSSTIYALPEMGNNNRVEVNIPIKSTGDYTLTATIKVYTDDESVDPRISLYYWYDDGSENGFRLNFEDVMLQKDGNQHEYSVSRVQSSPVISHIRGYILNDSNRDSLYSKHALVSEIRVNYIP